jgi:hypothetical protein
VESLRFDFGAGGELHLFGREMLREGVELSAAGLIRMPSEGSSPDTWFHDAGGSTVIRDEAGYRFSMASLVKLGACPGEPIAGEIVYEFEADVLSGPIEGAPNGDGQNSSEFSYGPDAHGGHVYFDLGGVLHVEVDGNEIVSGYLVIPGERLGTPTVYCVGGGSYSKREDSAFPFPRDAVYVMTDLSRLGAGASMAPAAGSLQGCYDFTNP